LKTLPKVSCTTVICAPMPIFPPGRFLQIGRGGQVVGVDVRFEQPLDGESARPNEVDDRVGRPMGDATRRVVDVHDGVDAAIVGLSPAALSQHLGKMRALRLVDTRRDGQTIYYRLASREVRGILETLYRRYCAPRR
jgi:DNA-binding transcriptional ArsR family regulator